MNSLSTSRFLFEFILFFSNSLSVFRIHLESTISCETTMISPWNHFKITRNSSSFSRMSYGFTICFAISFWIHSIFSNSLSVLRIYLESTSLSNHYDFDIKSLWIHYLLHAFTRNSSSVSQILYKFTICFVIFHWIRYFFLNSLLIHYLLRDFNMNSISISRIHLESTFSRQITMNLRSASRFFYEFTICFPNSPWIPYLFCDSTMNSLAITRIHEEFTKNSRRIHEEFTKNSRRIHEEFTKNSLSSLRFH